MSDDIVRAKIVDVFLSLLSKHDWEDVTLTKIAEDADIKLSELRTYFDGKIAIVEEFSRRIDAEVLDNIDAEVADELPRERLMDVLLSRLDALADHKPAVEAMMRAARQDLTLAAQFNRILLVSMTWMLHAANIDTGGVEGAVRVQGVAVVFGKVLKVWVRDDPDMHRSLAKLDRELRRGERMIRRMDRVTSVLSSLKSFSRRRRSRRSVDEILNEEVEA